MTITTHSDYKAATAAAMAAGLPADELDQLTADLIDGDLEAAIRVISDAKAIKAALKRIDKKFGNHSHGSDLLTDLDPADARAIFCRREAASLLYVARKTQQIC